MSESLVKICGLRSPEMAQVASEAGASTIGLMFAPSKRRITIDEAHAIVRDLPVSRPAIAGVFVNSPLSELIMTRDRVGLDIIQLSGDEEVELLDDLDGPVWKALRFSEDATLEEARRAMDPWVSSNRPVQAVLIDAAVAGAYGGTGHRANWDLVASLAEEYPVMLAGGLNPGNVADAIRQAHPLGVDVSSGVEQNGTKSPALINAFLAAVRSVSD